MESTAQASPAVKPVTTEPVVDGASTSGAAGAAASMAASVVFTGRSVAAAVSPKNVMIVVDEPESTRPDKKRRTVRRAKTQAEPQVKKALEKTF